MDNTTYYIVLVLMVIIGYSLYKSNHTILMAFVLVVGVYVVYSHETGNTATQWKRDAVKSLDRSAEEWKPELVYDKDKEGNVNSTEIDSPNLENGTKAQESSGDWTPDFKPDSKY